MLIEKATPTLSGKWMLEVKCEVCGQTFFTTAEVPFSTNTDDIKSGLETFVALLKCPSCEYEEEELK